MIFDQCEIQPVDGNLAEKESDPRATHPSQRASDAHTLCRGWYQR